MRKYIFYKTLLFYKIRYYGGKGNHGRQIAAVIMKLLSKLNIESLGSSQNATHTTDSGNSSNSRNVVYIEPFCGALGVLRYMSAYVKKCYANDVCKDIAILFRQVKAGSFQNPQIDKDKWTHYKTSNKPSAERAFAGFGCSFGGVWFNGYISNKENNDMTYSSLVRLTPKLQNTIFSDKSYDDLLGNFNFKNDTTYIIYMDPPYEGTCNLPWGGFDSVSFWKIARKLSTRPNVHVLVSEISAPEDFKCVYKFKRSNGMRHSCGDLTIEEKIYVLNSSPLGNVDLTDLVEMTNPRKALKLLQNM